MDVTKYSSLFDHTVKYWYAPARLTFSGAPDKNWAQNWMHAWDYKYHCYSQCNYYCYIYNVVCKTRAVGSSENPAGYQTKALWRRRFCFYFCHNLVGRGWIAPLPPSSCSSDGPEDQYVRKLAGYCKTEQSNNGWTSKIFGRAGINARINLLSKLTSICK